MKKLTDFCYLLGTLVSALALFSCNYTNYNLYNSKPNTYHVVRAGETLHSIAKENDILVERLAKLNHLKLPYNIAAGQRLILPTFSYYTYLKEQQNRNKQLSYNSNKVSAKNFITSQENIKSQPKILENRNNSTGQASKSLAYHDKKWLKPVLSDVQSNNKKTNIKASANDKEWIWPAKGKIVNNFGIKGSKSNISNKGIDIFGKKGDPITATANGKVVYCGSNLQEYGNLIIIKHNPDFLSAYAYNEKILITEQQEVKQGQQIATMGDSDSKKALLHFEIRYKGKPVDPIKILAQKEN